MFYIPPILCYVIGFSFKKRFCGEINSGNTELKHSQMSAVFLRKLLYTFIRAVTVFSGPHSYLAIEFHCETVSLGILLLKV